MGAIQVTKRIIKLGELNLSRIVIGNWSILVRKESRTFK